MASVIPPLEYGVKSRDLDLIKEFNYQDYKSRLS